MVVYFGSVRRIGPINRPKRLSTVKKRAVMEYDLAGHNVRGRLVVTAARTKTDGSEKSFSGARPTIMPTLTPGAMAWPKWHSAEPSHRVRIAHHRARHERAHLPSPLQPHGSSPTALRSHPDCLAHRPPHWKARAIVALCPCVCV